MYRILQKCDIDNLPIQELTSTLHAFLEPVSMHLPEKRLREVSNLAVQGVISGQSPLVTQMARGVEREEETIWPMAKRVYRFIWNKRFSHRDLPHPVQNVIRYPGATVVKSITAPFRSVFDDLFPAQIQWCELFHGSLSLLSTQVFFVALVACTSYHET